MIASFNNKFTYYSEGIYEGKTILVQAIETYPCPIEGHELEEIENYGQPTGMLHCPICGGIADKGEE